MTYTFQCCFGCCRPKTDVYFVVDLGKRSEMFTEAVQGLRKASRP